MISPKNPEFLSPVVMANSEPSAQLAGSPTTACFSFCSSLGLAGTEGIPVPGQANSTTCLCAEPAWGHTRCHSTIPALAALSPDPSTALLVSLPSCQGAAWLSSAMPGQHH